LGRCDRAPVAWAERHPMPVGVHAWVYAGRSRKRLEEVLRRLAAGEDPPAHNPDAEFAPNTNLDRPAWDIDVYARAGWPRDYRAVRWFVEELNAVRNPIAPPPRELPGQD